MIAKFLGSHSLTVDFVDHFRGEGEDFDYNWEERWIRDEGYTKLVPQAVKALLEKTGVAAGDIAHFIMPCPFAKFDQTIAKRCGIAPEAVRDNLAATVGDPGPARALLMLVHALAGRQARREDPDRAIRQWLRRASVRDDAGHRRCSRAAASRPRSPAARKKRIT